MGQGITGMREEGQIPPWDPNGAAVCTADCHFPNGLIYVIITRFSPENESPIRELCMDQEVHTW